MEGQVVLEDGIKSQEVEEPMTRILSETKVINVSNIGYHCQLEVIYLSQIPEHRRRSPQTWRRVSRVKNIKVFKHNHNSKELSEEYHMDSEQVMALPFCYNCGGSCPQNQWFEEATE